jgi:PAS domain S-box-containing protein
MLAPSLDATDYRALFMNTHTIMLLVEPHSRRIVDANPAAEAFYGWSRTRLCNMNLAEIAPAAQDDLADTSEAGRPEGGSMLVQQHRRADGSMRTVEVCSGPVTVRGATLLFVVIHDVTARQSALEAYQHSEAALKLSQAVAHLGHWSWDLRTNTVSVSDELRRIYALEPAAISPDLEAMLELIIHPDDVAHARNLRNAILNEQDIGEAEYRIVWPDGKVRTVWTLPAAKTLDSEGRLVHLIGVVQDITERKQAEALRERQERLAAVGQLAAGIAHDFNNILSIVTIYASMLSDLPVLDAREQGYVSAILEQVQRATRLIRQVLDFSRRSILERQPLDLLPLFKEQAQLLRQTFPETIEVSLHYQSGTYVVRADITRMQQLLMNLAVNARDAMPQGGKLRIELACLTAGPGLPAPLRELAPGPWVRLAVQDTGSGIAGEHLQHVFEPFFTTKEPGQGTGLGLAQVHGIVAQHEGQITVTSSPGVGTTFAVYLPALADTAELADAPPVSSVLPAGQGECILLVEDDDVLRASLAQLISNWNYRVVEANNGQAALDYLAAGTRPAIDIIVSDVVMPKLGGISLAERLRRLGVPAPVILMSGHPMQEERADLQDLRITAWLDKPPSPWLLAQALARACDHGTGP